MSKEIDEARRKELHALSVEIAEREEQIYRDHGFDVKNPIGFDCFQTDEIIALRKEEALRYKAIVKKYADK